MRWDNGRRSSNIEDRRGQGARPMAAGGMGAMMLLRFLPLLLRSKMGRMLLLVGVLVFVGARFLNIDLLGLLGGGGLAGITSGSTQREPTREEQELADFVALVLGDTEIAWQAQFQQMGRNYVEPTLVLYTGSVSSACGLGRAAMGPFYCPGDQKVYLDLSFFQDLRARHGAPGDFAQAYVVAHEVGHHVQTLLGISEKVHQARSRLPEAEANALSVRQELQADCFAGLWGHVANRERQVLEPGDLEEALIAAAAIGDDRLQKQGQGYVVPESFTHGTSEQRVEWFRRGFTQGKFSACDTFAGGV